jgi:prepilin-type N-terminal cleavage/methylation domain-containing protein
MHHRNNGFSLIELMIAIMIVGILTAVAIPRYFQHVARSNDQALRINLLSVRDAIERYKVDHDRALPSGENEATFKNALSVYLKTFPKVKISNSQPAANYVADGVAIVSSGGSINAETESLAGWRYNPTTGQFIINHNLPTAIDPSTSYDEW